MLETMYDYEFDIANGHIYGQIRAKIKNEWQNVMAVVEAEGVMKRENISDEVKELLKNKIKEILKEIK